MTYLLIMMGIVGMLFATDGGRDLDVFTSQDTPQVTLDEAEGALKRLEWVQAPKERYGLFRLQLDDRRQCFLGRSKQGLDCSAQAVESFSTEVLAFRFYPSKPPSPRLFRLRLKDGAECIGNFAQTGLSCRFGTPAEGPLPELESAGTFGGDEKKPTGPRFFQAQFSDGTLCLMPRAKNALHCRWGP